MDARIHHIIETIYSDRRFVEFLNKLEPAELRQDLRHFVTTELYRIAEQHPGKLEKLHVKNEMFGFVYGMARNTLMSERGTFYRHYRQSVHRKLISFDGPIEEAIKATPAESEPSANFTAALNSLSDADRALLAKAERLLGKMTKDERKQAARLTKDEKQRLEYLKPLLRYRQEVCEGSHLHRYARFAVTITVTLPKGCNTDAVLDAADWLHGVGTNLLMQAAQGHAVVDIAPPKLISSNLCTWNN